LNPKVRRPSRASDVEGDLGGMGLEGEPDPHLVEDVQDGIPARREVGEPILDHRGGDRREGVEERPDGAAGESVDHLHPEVRRRSRGELHLLGCAGSHSLRVAVSPHVGLQDGLVPLVDAVAHRLSHQVIADRPHVESVGLEQLPPGHAVVGVLGGPADVEVVPPAGQLQPVVPPGRRLLGEEGEGQVRPLTGEERHDSRHGMRPQFGGV
jgi:hypothetical protein